MRKTSKQYAALMQLSGLLNGYKLRNIDILDNKDSESNYTKFFRFLKGNHADNETLAAQSIGYEDENDPNYRRFRVDYRIKLLQTLFFIDAANPVFKEHTQAILRCSQQAAILGIVKKFGYEDTVALYGKELLEQTQKFELTEVSLKVATILRNTYVQKLKDKNEYLKYKDLCEKLEIEYTTERKALAYFDDLMSFYTKSIDIQPEVYSLADTYFRDLYPQLNENSSCMLITNTYTIAVVKYLSRLDYKSLLETCDKAIGAIRKKHYNADNYLTLFLNNKILAETNLERYSEAEETSKEVLSVTVEGHNNWFNSIERIIRLAFHQSNFESAFELFKKARKHKNFGALTESVKEDWYIIEAYMAFLEKIKVLPNGSVNFKLGKFENAVPMAEKDKAGRNINIQIIRILHQILDKGSDVEEKIENLLRYHNRYVETEQYTRSYLFTCILKCITENMSNLNSMQQTTNDFFTRLLAKKYDFNNKYYQEIIPLHVIWGNFGEKILLKAA
jgi:tetratricopeptide (TPR) repeat protein